MSPSVVCSPCGMSLNVLTAVSPSPPVFVTLLPVVVCSGLVIDTGLSSVCVCLPVYQYITSCTISVCHFFRYVFGACIVTAHVIWFVKVCCFICGCVADFVNSLFFNWVPSLVTISLCVIICDTVTIDKCIFCCVTTSMFLSYGVALVMSLGTVTTLDTVLAVMLLVLLVHVASCATGFLIITSLSLLSLTNITIYQP